MSVRVRFFYTEKLIIVLHVLRLLEMQMSINDFGGKRCGSGRFVCTCVCGGGGDSCVRACVRACVSCVHACVCVSFLSSCPAMDITAA